MDVTRYLLGASFGLAIVGAVWLLVNWAFWLRDRRRRRAVEDRRRAEQFRREFTAAVGRIPPPPSVPSQSGGPLTLAHALAIRSGMPPITSRPTMPRSKNDKSYFEGRGATSGVVYGMRNFKVDRLFRLTAYIYPGWVWKPGENIARCLRNPNGTGTSVPAPGFAADHPMIGCLHGFYAYYDGSRDYHEKGDVTGIIKGWGEAVVGDKGFRVMRAQIVAIKFSGSMEDATKRRVMRNYPDVAVFNSVEDMLREFPTSAGGLEYEPDKDEDFWTREA